MAGLSGLAGPDRRGDRDRGQILLLAAFSLAVTFVALSVVVNGAIFAQNLATRGDTAGSTEALQDRQQVETMAGSVLERANDDHAGSPGTIETEFEKAIEELSRVSGSQQALSGRAVNYTYRTKTDGTRIYDNTGDFTNATGSVDWVVAETVPDTRRFDIQVSSVSALSTLLGDAFTVNLTAGSDTWELKIYDDGSGVAVETTDGNGNTATCSTGSSTANINVTAGKLDDKPCEALDFGQNLTGDYDLVFNNSDNIEGTYSVVVNATGSDIGNVPNDERVLYSTRLGYTYRTVNLRYETEIRVAPGESDG